jgi:hypothetical protein
MQKYPFSTLTNYNYGQGGRLILFLVPSIIIIVAEGINYFRNKHGASAYLYDLS